MSSRSTFAAVATILKAYDELSLEEFETLYGVEVDIESGSVYDLTEDESFRSVKAWATFAAELEADDNYGHREGLGGRQRGEFDDY